MSEQGMLHPYRVIDLTGERGSMTGFLLAQLGADVVLVEPPEGRERGADFDAYNRGKRSAVAGNADEVARLAATADVVITDHSLLDAPPMGDLRSANPALVTVSLTPYGETGPKADWKATDLTLFAASGQLSCTGDRDRPPVRISAPQAWGHACSQAAVATLVALEDRVHTGHGQHIDLSALQAVSEAALPANLWAAAGLPPVERWAGGLKVGEQILQMVYPCADGVIIVTVSFGPMIGPMVGRFVDWMYREGACDETMRDHDFVEFALDIAEGRVPVSELDRLVSLIAAFVATKTKAELQQQGLDDVLLVCAASTLEDLLSSEQLAYRDFWDDVDGERHPGPIVNASATPLRRLPAAPRLGADTDVLLSEQRAAPPAPAGPAPERLPLEGIRICDLSWVAAGPLTTKILAYWGAEVIRVESSLRPCLLRQALGHRDDVPDQENGLCWHTVNANKLGLALNLGLPEARDVVRDLVATSDVVFESFTPGTLARWGLAYEDLREIKPDIVMASSCVMGQTGPMRSFAGFGNMAAAVAGFFDVCGWPDRLPAGPYMAYTDYTSPRFTAMAILAALDHRRRTGEGQYLDFSQMAAATHLLTPALLDYQRTGEMLTRMGNADPAMSPHGVYPGCLPDSWIAIAVENDEQWRSLAVEMRRTDLAELTLDERRARAGELDEIIGQWTARQDPGGLHFRLQAHGIAAHKVASAADCMNDPQFVHRNHFQWAPHPEARQVLVDGMPYTMSRSHSSFRWGGPTYGQHTMEVLEGILGYDIDRIADLAAAGALE
jgi:crotonobetainyl-CoA:carnitine CoA-transferase CaiB-like acyl-CoA transferase